MTGGTTQVGAGRELLVGTRSAGKLRELVPLLEAAGFVPRAPDEVGIPEDAEEATLERFDSFAENARAKARWFAGRSGGRLVLAEDSGLEVEVLGGRPGVLSKRWAGREDLGGEALDAANTRHLLGALEAIGARAPADRRARYVCVAVLVGEGGRECVGCGVTSGTILSAPVGRGGFGYDPVFLSEELGRTFAEVDQALKASVSHRGRAIAALLRAYARVVPPFGRDAPRGGEAAVDQRPRRM